ncbi:DnaJ C-terminal domain-containing protein [Thiolinea disciformis]|uniref:DnaJ C-terminal domain-containing protein n=1 Tax=Thiolinea disciformis TaxID=125614 RepID=UPI00037799C1|nr:DnaJ C-terminal domain-containing protein [Thiolinea disciformis]
MALHHKEYKDYYSILGVSRTADLTTIRQAYRRLARKYHPDVSQEQNAEERFKAVNEAYDVLGSPDKRVLYDAKKPEPPRESRSPRSSSTYSAPKTNPQPKRDRPDVAFFEDINRNTAAHVPESNGFGSFLGSIFSRKNKPNPASQAQIASPETVVELHIEETFSDTIKSVTTPAGKAIQIRVPKGATDGKKLRLPGHGAKGQDLMLTLRVLPHEHYQFKGADIYRDLPITPWEAALGATISIPTPQGPVKLKVAPSSQNGSKLRLAGKGLQLDQMQGDMYVTLVIHTPPAYSEIQRDFYQRMQQLFSWNPRKH